MFDGEAAALAVVVGATVGAAVAMGGGAGVADVSGGAAAVVGSGFAAPAGGSLLHAASKGEAVNAQRKRAAERSPDIGRSLSPDTAADVEPKGDSPSSSVQALAPSEDLTGATDE
jgi:hypothetical protein